MSAWLKGWRDSPSRIVDSASHMKIGLDPTSWMKNSASSMKDDVDSRSCMNNLVSRLKFPSCRMRMNLSSCKKENSTSGLRVSIANLRNSMIHSGDLASGRVSQGTRLVAEDTRRVRVNMDY